MRRKLWFSLLFSLTLVHGYSQDQSALISLGKLAYSQGDAYTAIYYFEEALKLGPESPDIWFLMGEASRSVHDYAKAFKAYQSSLKWSIDTLCIAHLYSGLMLKQLGRYTEAIPEFELYQNCPTQAPNLFKRAELEISSCRYANENIHDTVGNLVEHLGPEINTQFSEFAAQQIADSVLFFSSLRPARMSADNQYIPEDFYTQLYISHISSVGWMTSELADKVLNRGRSHVANAFFANNGNTVYFTRCDVIEGGLKRCHIYTSKRHGKKWSKPKSIEGGINIEGYSSTQPCYHKMAGDLGVLYFSSDRPGGFGGFDLWYCISEDGEFGKPVNLGSIINTPGQEVSPFYFENTLFFSSDWHKGFGGLDIFWSNGSFNGWSKPINLGIPTNSSTDDLNFSVNMDGNSGYLTSNRPGSLHLQGETCCYDIYYWESIPPPPPEPEPVDTLVDLGDSLARAILPIALYFDNDVPDPTSKSPITKTDYLSTLKEYSLKLEKYQSEYSKGLSGNQAVKARNDIRQFFEDQIEGGFTKLELLGEYLETDLIVEQENVRLEVKGFTSPLNTTEYNYNLAQRRIESLKNYLRLYDHGALEPYMSDTITVGPKLEIVSTPVGESMSAPYVSDNPNDIRNSVYSISAALERRIEITNYQSGNAIPQDQKFAQLTLLDATTLASGQTGKNIALTFHYINSGQTALNITSITSECGCIKASYPDVEISPGEKGNFYLLIPSNEPGYYSTNIIIDFIPANKSLILPLQWNFSVP